MRLRGKLAAPLKASLKEKPQTEPRAVLTSPAGQWMFAIPRGPDRFDLIRDPELTRELQMTPLWAKSNRSERKTENPKAEVSPELLRPHS